MSKSSGRGAIASASFNRRRVLAALGALGLSPAILPVMARGAESAEGKWVCKVAEPTIVGVHELRYHVEDQSVTGITATMRLDLDGTGWMAADLVVHGADSRDISLRVPKAAMAQSWRRTPPGVARFSNACRPGRVATSSRR